MARMPDAEPMSISLTVKNGNDLGLKSASVNSDRTARESGPMTQRAVYNEVTSEMLTLALFPPANFCC
jgi:hypothetical protein